jgi:hypothetical protein
VCPEEVFEYHPFRGPVTKRIQVQIQFGHDFALIWKAIVNLAGLGFIHIEVHLIG